MYLIKGKYNMSLIFDAKRNILLDRKTAVGKRRLLMSVDIVPNYKDVMRLLLHDILRTPN